VTDTRNIGETEEQTYENPVFNRRFQFDCDINDIIRVQVLDAGNQNAGYIQTQIAMTELKNLMDDVSSEIKEYWFDFSDTTGRKQGTQIRINFNYLFSKFVMYDQ
jgi:hypothetical protein